MSLYIKFLDDDIDNSFISKWPKEQIISLNKIKQAGFKYTHKKDIVICLKCRLKLYNWDIDDDPLLLHLFYTPFCNFQTIKKKTILN